ncbi:hypothetical protein D9M68_449090 [compost metagenome]
MRFNIVSPVGNDGHDVGHLQGSGTDLSLADRYRQDSRVSPAIVIHFIIVGCPKELGCLFTGKIYA